MFNGKKFFVTMAAVLFLTAPGFAQQDAKPRTNEPRAAMSDGDLMAFVRVYVENQRIRDFFEPDLMDATGIAEREALENEANAELMESLAEENMSVNDYNAIFILVNRDEPLRVRVLKLVAQERADTK